MSLNKYTDFQKKVNAKYHGDPNGTYIMAEDINLIQDSVNELEKSIGIHSNDKTIAERIAILEFSSSKEVQDFLIYKGNPLVAYESFAEAVHAFSFVDYLVLQKNEDSAFENFLAEIQKHQSSFYGYILCDSPVSLAVLQLEIEWWRSKGASGIFLDHFDYDFGNTRARQNDILLSVQERNMRAIVTGSVDNILINVENPQMNPEWEPIHFKSTDGFWTMNPFITNAVKNSYDSVLSLSKKMLEAKKDLGISIYVSDTANGSSSATQVLYEHGRSLASLFGFNGYSLSRTDFYQLNDPVRYNDWSPFLSGSTESVPSLIETTASIKRRMPFGELIYAKSTNTVIFTGLTIPSFILTWKENTIPGTAIQDGTIEDKKIKEYDGNRLIASINKDSVTERIKVSRIEKFGLGDLEGSVSVDSLKANVIEAINAHIGNAVIDNAFIGNLRADQISASVIEAVNIAAGHADFGSVNIHAAVIKKLQAEQIEAGHIAAERIEANVIAAINAKFTSATIDSAVIGELKAENITASVIQAINMYAESAIIDKAKINTAIIGELTAKHIEASVIDALEANIGKATINSALIGKLEAGHIEASVIDAINANIGTAFIQGGIIKEGTIMDAHIMELNAKKITAGTIDTSKVTISGLDGHMVIKDNQITIYDEVDAQGNRRKRVVLGKDDVTGKNTYGLVVLGADGQTRLYDETGVYNAGIQPNAVSNSKLQDDAVDARVIKVGSVMADHIMADAIVGEKIKAGSIISSHIQAGVITSDKLYSGGKLRSVSDNRTVTASNGAASLVNGGPCARGLTAGYWKAIANSTLTVDLGSLIGDIREISFTTYPSNDSNKIPVSYKLEGSADNTAWGLIKSTTNNSLPIMVETVTTNTKYRYIRLTIVATTAGQTESTIANFEVKSLEGGTVISGNTITTGTIDANVVNVINLKAGSVTIGSDTVFQDGYNPNEVLGITQKLSTNGLVIKPDYSSFTQATIGSFYFHGLDGKGNPADIDGFITVNGIRVNVKKGRLTPKDIADGYVLYDSTLQKWYLVSIDNKQVFKRYNEGTTEHGTTFTPNDKTQYWLGEIHV